VPSGSGFSSRCDQSLIVCSRTGAGPVISIAACLRRQSTLPEGARRVSDAAARASLRILTACGRPVGSTPPGRIAGAAPSNQIQSAEGNPMDESEIEGKPHRPLIERAIATGESGHWGSDQRSPCRPVDAARSVKKLQEQHIGCILVTGADGKLAGFSPKRDLLNRWPAPARLEQGTGRRLHDARSETLGLTTASPGAQADAHRWVPARAADRSRGPAGGVVSIKDIIEYIIDLFPSPVLNLPPEPHRGLRPTGRRHGLIGPQAMSREKQPEPAQGHHAGRGSRREPARAPQVAHQRPSGDDDAGLPAFDPQVERQEAPPPAPSEARPAHATRWQPEPVHQAESET